MSQDANRILVSEAMNRGFLSPQQANTVLKAIKGAETSGAVLNLREYLLTHKIVSARRWEEFEKYVEKKRAPKASEPSASDPAKDTLLAAPLKPAEAAEPQLPFDIGGYRLTEKIGQGGMGSVYKATQLMLRRTVAIKLLPPRLAQDPAYVATFKQEARAAAAINHPNVVVPIEVGEAQGIHYLAMELIDGESVGQWMDRKGRLPWRDAVEIAKQVARGLETAHKQAIVHRDIKPDNILLDRANGMAKITDLGLAKRAGEDGNLSRNGQPVGTPYYASPEQGRAQKDIDGRSDIYSLGATLWHTIVGVPPFEGINAAVIMTKHITEPLPDPRSSLPECPDDLVAIIMKMMAKDRDERYANCAQLSEDLEALLAAQPLVHARLERRNAKAHAAAPTALPRAGGPNVSRLRGPNMSRPAASRLRGPALSRAGGAHAPSRETKPSMIPWIAGAGLLILGLAAAGFMSSKDNAEPPASAAPTKSAGPAKSKTAPDKTSGGKTDALAEQKTPAVVMPMPRAMTIEAQRALKEAREFAQKNPTKAEEIVDRYTQVGLKYPGTPEASEAVQESEPYRTALKALKRESNP